MEKKYWMLEVLDEKPRLINGLNNYLFRCECGTEIYKPMAYVKRGRIKSCGCLSLSKKIIKESVTQRKSTELKPPKNLYGLKFGHWDPLDNKYKRYNKSIYWLCRCICGAEKYIDIKELKRGKSKSCGCKRKELFSKKTLIHGQSSHNKTIEYETWLAMRRRCLSEKHKSYPDYGGRGIKICDRWLNSFLCFFEDMGNRPSKEYSLDRIDYNGNYEPENCKWATQKEQQNNRRSNKIIKYNDENYTLSQLANKFNIRHDTLNWRLKNNWGLERALTERVGNFKKCGENK